jgi:hypothetical protein
MRMILCGQAVLLPLLGVLTAFACSDLTERLSLWWATTGLKHCCLIWSYQRVYVMIIQWSYVDSYSEWWCALLWGQWRHLMMVCLAMRAPDGGVPCYEGNEGTWWWCALQWGHLMILSSHLFSRLCILRNMCHKLSYLKRLKTCYSVNSCSTMLSKFSYPYWFLHLQGSVWYCHSSNDSFTCRGLSGNAISLVYYGAPLSTMAEVIKTRNSASILLPLTLMNLINALLWWDSVEVVASRPAHPRIAFVDCCSWQELLKMWARATVCSLSLYSSLFYTFGAHACHSCCV